jgi:hypothetical protein
MSIDKKLANPGTGELQHEIISLTHVSKFQFNSSGNLTADINIYLRLVGGIVVCSVRTTPQATSNGSDIRLFLETPIPAQFRPTTPYSHQPVGIMSGGTRQADPGFVIIDGAGDLRLFKQFDNNSATFASGNSGYSEPFTMVWTTD